MTEVSSNSAPELEPSLQAFASGWSQALQSQVLLAAQSAVHSANLTEHHPPSRWLEALTRHVQIEGKVQTHKEPKDSVQAHEQEIANDLLLVSLRLLPAPPKPAHGQPEQPQPIYSAIDRLLMHNTLRILDINLNVAHEAEKAVAQQLYFVMQQAEAAAAVQQEKENSQKNKWSSSVAQSLNNSTKSWKWAATGAG